MDLEEWKRQSAEGAWYEGLVRWGAGLLLLAAAATGIYLGYQLEQDHRPDSVKQREDARVRAAFEYQRDVIAGDAQPVYERDGFRFTAKQLRETLRQLEEAEEAARSP